MASGKFRWISAADNCQIWDENFEVIHKFEEGNVLDVACNQDASSLAFIQKANKQICTVAIGSQIYQNSTVITEGEATSLGFSNELLLAGTSLGSVLLWDQSKHKLIRKYEGIDRTPVCRIQSSGSIIAAGHFGGSIQVYGIKTGQPVGQYSVTNSGGLRDLKISSVKTSIMAAAFNSGSIGVWNSHSNKGNPLIVEFSSAHQSPATSVALSPITEILMVSGGLDKNVILYDLPKKKILKKIEIDAPVTAIEFFPEGSSLIVGTNRGKILIFDLRNIATPVQSIIAHTTSITKLICRASTQIQNKIESGIKKVSRIPSSSKNESPTAQPPLSTKELPEKLYRFPFPSPMMTHDDRESRALGKSLLTGEAKSKDAEFQLTPGFANASKDSEHKNSSLFSPIKGENSVDLFSSPSLATSPLLLKYKGNDYKEQKEIPPLRSETLLSIGNDDIEVPSSSPDLSPSNQSHFTIEGSKQSENKIQPEASVDFQAEFIRRIVHDVEENLREVLRCRFGDLIIQSAQQFLTLQNELEQLRQQIQEKAHLEEEVKQLRSEVNQLRNLF